MNHPECQETPGSLTQSTEIDGDSHCLHASVMDVDTSYSDSQLEQYSCHFVHISH